MESPDALEAVPMLQFVHSACPGKGGVLVPGGHDAQAELPLDDANVPGLQESQSRAPVDDDCVPGGHGAHDANPSEDWLVPWGQGVHHVVPIDKLEKVPGGHNPQEEAAYIAVA